jgi:hypothetical protein
MAVTAPVTTPAKTAMRMTLLEAFDDSELILTPPK